MNELLIAASIGSVLGALYPFTLSKLKSIKLVQTSVHAACGISASYYLTPPLVDYFEVKQYVEPTSFLVGLVGMSIIRFVIDRFESYKKVANAVDIINKLRK